jgi:hypothetical protein
MHCTLLRSCTVALGLESFFGVVINFVRNLGFIWYHIFILEPPTRHLITSSNQKPSEA